MTGMYEKVLDWVNDFDHADPEYNERAHEIWEEFQGSECPVAHSERYDGLWAPFTYEMVHEIAYDTEHFTSQGVVVNTGRPLIEAPVGPAPPITSDPPFHNIARRLLL
ncbi:MAG: cytochrome P450, partial [Acidimicrobiaceae bacterium]